MTIVPIEKVTSTDIDQIIIGLTKINARERLTDKKWRITIRKRYAQEIDRQELILKVGDAIGDVGTVNLTDYDLELRIEILSQETGLSIIPPELDIQIKQYELFQDIQDLFRHGHEHVSGDQAGCHCVDANVVATEFARPDLGHAYNAGFGGNIVSLSEIAIKPNDRSGV